VQVGSLTVAADHFDTANNNALERALTLLAQPKK
jgi:hypothetical protein